MQDAHMCVESCILFLQLLMYMYVCTYVYIYIYTYTHTHTFGSLRVCFQAASLGPPAGH